MHQAVQAAAVAWMIICSLQLGDRYLIPENACLTTIDIGFSFQNLIVFILTF